MPFLLTLLRLIPWWIYPLAALLVWGWWGHREARLQAGRALEAQQTALVAQEEARQRKEIADEQLRLTNTRATIAAADAEQAQRNLDAAAANHAAAERVLKRAADLVAAGRATPATVVVPGSAPADQLGAALEACVRSYAELADDAVDAVRRGERCSAEYEALRK